MEWSQDLIRLFREKLAYLIPSERDARMTLEDVGINPANIDLSGSPMSRWASAISETKKHQRLDRLLQLASEQYPNDDFLIAMRSGQLVVQPQPTINWHGPDHPNLEKLTASENTLVSISFLERGLDVARCVARIRIPGIGFSIGFGTGFLISENLILTNHHVLKNSTQAEGAFADFKYERQLDGTLQQQVNLELDPDQCFFTSPEHDWTVVGVKGFPGKEYGWINLDNHQAQVDDYVQIIQHPNGEEKQLAYRSNIVVHSDATYLQYLTDTLPGSSGSPVFNREWKLVALHHAGGKPGNGIVGTGKYVRNQGIQIGTISRDLKIYGIA